MRSIRCELAPPIMVATMRTIRREHASTLVVASMLPIRQEHASTLTAAPMQPIRLEHASTLVFASMFMQLLYVSMVVLCWRRCFNACGVASYDSILCRESAALACSKSSVYCSNSQVEISGFGSNAH